MSYYSLTEAARELGVTVPLVLKWLHEYRLRGTYVGDTGFIVNAEDVLHLKQTSEESERVNEALHLYHKYLEYIAECECLCEGGFTHNSARYRDYSLKLSRFLVPARIYIDTLLDDLYVSVKACDTGTLALEGLLQEMCNAQTWFVPDCQMPQCFRVFASIFVNCGGCITYTGRGEDLLRVKPMEGTFLVAHVDCAKDYSDYLKAIYKHLYKAIYELDSVVGVDGKPEFRSSSFQCGLDFITPEEYMKLLEQYSDYTIPRVAEFYTCRPDLIQSGTDAWITSVYDSLEAFSDLFRELVQNSTLELYRRRNLHRRK